MSVWNGSIRRNRRLFPSAVLFVAKQKLSIWYMNNAWRKALSSVTAICHLFTFYLVSELFRSLVEGGDRCWPCARWTALPRTDSGCWLKSRTLARCGKMFLLERKLKRNCIISELTCYSSWWNCISKLICTVTNYVAQEPEGSSPHSQQPATSPYSEPVKSGPHA
jgi:hypothetical protein